jgi:hypothetical protein
MAKSEDKSRRFPLGGYTAADSAGDIFRRTESRIKVRPPAPAPMIAREQTVRTDEVVRATKEQAPPKK